MAEATLCGYLCITGLTDVRFLVNVPALFSVFVFSFKSPHSRPSRALPQNYVQDYPTLTTCFEAEIISPKYPFLTRKWDANERIDRTHWVRRSFWSDREPPHSMMCVALTSARIPGVTIYFCAKIV